MLNERRETFQAAGKLNFIHCRTLDTFIKYDIEHCIQYTFYIVTGSTGWTKKKWDLKNNGHNSAEIHQKGKKLVCFGKFCINAAG